MTEWNEWRVYHPELPIFLEGADLNWLHLGDANLAGAYLNKAQLNNAHLEESYLWHVQLNEAQLRNTHFERADMLGAQLKNADIHLTHFENTKLHGARFDGSELYHPYFENAILTEAHFNNTRIHKARLEGAQLSGSHLDGALFHFAVVDGETMIDGCTTNEQTIFNGVGLDTCRMDPEIKQDLEYARRRNAWEAWYPAHPIMKFPAATFWSLSDYGRSITSIIGCFFIASILFSIIYSLGGDALISNLQSTTTTIDDVTQTHHFTLTQRICRSFYFSIVTMTTLGYGDMYASTQSIWGYILLISQVLFGYLMLGALITRFSIMLTANGPNGPMTIQTSSLKAYFPILLNRHREIAITAAYKKNRTPPPTSTHPAPSATRKTKLFKRSFKPLPSRPRPSSTCPNAESTSEHVCDTPRKTRHAP